MVLRVVFRGVWDGASGEGLVVCLAGCLAWVFGPVWDWSGTRPARGFGPPLAGWCGVVWCGAPRRDLRDENGTFYRKIDVPKTVQK